MTEKWEAFCDECYYGLWRVRRKDQRNFNDGFHLQHQEEAEGLVRLLNDFENESGDGHVRTMLEEVSKMAAELKAERDEARDAAAKWESSFDAMERAGAEQARRADENREWALRAERERDEARELCRELTDLVAYGLGQSGEPWSLDAMREATAAIQKAKAVGGGA